MNIIVFIALTAVINLKASAHTLIVQISLHLYFSLSSYLLFINIIHVLIIYSVVNKTKGYIKKNLLIFKILPNLMMLYSVFWIITKKNAIHLMSLISL